MGMETMGKFDPTQEKLAKEVLAQEGVVSDEDARNALAQSKQELDAIAQQAQQYIEQSGGDVKSALEEARLNGETAIAEKLQVILNQSKAENRPTGQPNEVLEAVAHDKDPDVAIAEQELEQLDKNQIH